MTALDVKHQQKLLEEAVRKRLTELQLPAEELRELSWLAYRLQEGSAKLAAELCDLVFKPLRYKHLNGSTIHVIDSYIGHVEESIAEFREFYAKLEEKAREELEEECERAAGELEDGSSD